MSRIGADTEHLRLLGIQFRKAHHQLDLTRATIDAQIRRTRWVGHDAEVLRQTWSARHRGAIDGAAQMCSLAAKSLDRQVDQQMQASSVVNKSSTSASSAQPGTSVPASSPVTFPNETTSIALGADATAASILAGSNHRITIESFDGDRRRVTITDLDNVGAKGSVGAKVLMPVGGSVDYSASGKALVGVVNRRVFETDADGVKSVIASAELQRSADRSLSAVRMSSPALNLAITLFGGVVEHVMPKLNVLPEPTRTESLVEVRGVGALSALLPIGPQVQGAFTGIVRAGTASASGSQSYVVEAEGSIAATLSSSLLGATPIKGSKPAVAGDKSRLGTDRIRIELRGDAADRRALVTTEVTAGSTVEKTVSEVSLVGIGGDVVSEALADAVEQIRRGDIDSGLNTLSSVDLPAEVTSKASAVFDQVDTDRGIGLSGGAGVTIGAEATLNVTKTTKRD
ncbi:MAG: hypothetical protein KDB26_00285 [Microthrixaceae bacterium]|nr:hypothetical protein [Microthrixaceae bacterium]